MEAKVVQRERARELARQGTSYNEIVRQLHVSKSSVSAWCRDIIHELTPSQIADKLKRERVTNEKSKAIARERYLNNDRIKSIAGDLNVNVSTVVRWCQDLTRPKSVNAKTAARRKSTAPMAEHPYSDCRIYYSQTKDGLKTVNLNNVKTLARTTMSFARYLMSVKEGRILDKDEIVRHIDGPEDVIENLKLTTHEKEKLEHAANNKKPCVICSTPFSPKRSSQTMCSVKCSIESRKTTNGKSSSVQKERRCRGCGGTFVATSNATRFCGDVCRSTHTSKAGRVHKPVNPDDKRECVVCEGMFIPNSPSREHCYSQHCKDVIKAELLYEGKGG